MLGTDVFSDPQKRRRAAIDHLLLQIEEAMTVEPIHVSHFGVRAVGTTAEWFVVKEQPGEAALPTDVELEWTSKPPADGA